MTWKHTIKLIVLLLLIGSSIGVHRYLADHVPPRTLSLLSVPERTSSRSTNGALVVTAVRMLATGLPRTPVVTTPPSRALSVHSIYQLTPDDLCCCSNCVALLPRHYTSIWHVGAVTAETGALVPFYVASARNHCRIQTASGETAYGLLRRAYPCPRPERIVRIDGAEGVAGRVFFTLATGETGTLHLATGVWMKDGVALLP